MCWMTAASLERPPALKLLQPLLSVCQLLLKVFVALILPRCAAPSHEDVIISEGGSLEGEPDKIVSPLGERSAVAAAAPQSHPILSPEYRNSIIVPETSDRLPPMEAVNEAPMADVQLEPTALWQSEDDILLYIDGCAPIGRRTTTMLQDVR